VKSNDDVHFRAITHADIILRARHRTQIILDASIITATGSRGLQLYNCLWKTELKASTVDKDERKEGNEGHAGAKKGWG
jgi:hypothetical protein